jgi:NAD(P)-dependent dehydrogenase (short-subunit alcohol dehydrogenase family)
MAATAPGASPPDGPAALVFGGRGAIGAAVASDLAGRNYRVFRTSRRPGGDAIPVDPEGGCLGALGDLPPASVVVWAQGANRNDSVVDFDAEAFEAVLAANTTFVARTLAELLRLGKLLDGARLCVVSSIWELMARQAKLSYTVSKAALGGLVRSAAVDLAPRRILVNAVLPGVVDTPMTRSVLRPEQVAAFEDATGFRRLVSLADVVSLVGYLCSPDNTGVTGQSVVVDLGYSGGRIL